MKLETRKTDSSVRRNSSLLEFATPLFAPANCGLKSGLGLVKLEPALEAYALLFTPARRRLHGAVHWRWAFELEISARIMMRHRGNVILEPGLQEIAANWNPQERLEAAKLHRRFARQFYVSADVIDAQLISAPPRRPRPLGYRPIRRRLWN